MDSYNIIWPGWETVRLIGRGSFGAVYEIQRDVFGEIEKAALKVISIPQNSSDIEELYSEGYDDESITSTFQSHLKSIVAEYSLMRKMSSCPNIVNCDDVRYVQHDDGIGWDIFIKMELLTPLLKSLPTQIPEDMVRKLGIDICYALEACGKYHVVHRDIKPQNIFVSENGNFKLGDFGIAKTVEKTMGGTKIGTYKYMAPEVYNNQPYGANADLYSLGLVMYFLLNERRMPFVPLPPEKPKASLDEAARNRRLSGETLPAPAHGNKELKRIVLKACSYNSKDRYHTAAEMLEDLQGLCISRKPVEVKKKVPAIVANPKVQVEKSFTTASKDQNETFIILDESDSETLQFFKDRAATAARAASKKATATSSVEKAKENIPKKISTPSLDPRNDLLLMRQETERNKSIPKSGETVPETQARSAADVSGDLALLRNSAAASYRQQYWNTHSTEISQETSEPKTDKKRNIFPVIVAIVVLIAAAMLLFHFCSPNGEWPFSNSSGLQSQSLSMPNVTGQTLTQAKSFLSAKGIRVNVTYEKNNSFAENRVIAQSIRPGTTVTPETLVVLTISSGKETIKVTSVVGETNTVAIQKLKSQGFLVKEDHQYNNAIAAGKVISQDPYAGTSLIPGETVTIVVSKGPQPLQVTFDAAGGKTNEKNRTVYSGRKIGALPNPTRDGYQFAGWFTSDGRQIQADTTINASKDFTLTAKWSSASYKVSWNMDTGYSVTVKRTSSPSGAATGTLKNGATIYHGDVLSVTYTPNTGYSLTEKGKTSITVTGDVNASSIYASVQGKEYTYNIVYKSSNGTSLGTAVSTQRYGTTNTIAPKSFAGYNSPSSQTVNWDSISAKTITFVYTPSSVNSTSKSGSIYKTSTYNLSYSVTIEHRNRTASSVDIRLRWTATLWGATSETRNAYSQRFKATSGTVSTGTVVICPYGTWADRMAGTRQESVTSSWLTVPVNTTNATSVSLSIYYWQENQKGQDASTITSDPAANLSVTWSIPIPAY